ncbi:MAG: hypothetical protein ACT4QD_18915 [Acidobacteriota bacterium]
MSETSRGPEPSARASRRALVRRATTPFWDPGLLPRWLARGTAGIGAIAAVYYANTGLSLAHYDAKAHLVVSRRILDSLTPGWEQIGAVWLPLPHLLLMLPVQIDLFYRTGSVGVALSVLANALAAAAIAGTVLALTSSRVGALLAVALFVANANVLYLQSTPMTEPLLFGLTTLQVFLLTRWVLAKELEVPRAAGWVIVLACLTRYEAWPITGACLAASAFAWWRRGSPWAGVLRVHARLACYPILAVVAFLCFSRVTVGEWFVSSGFFVPDESLRGNPIAVATKIAEGLTMAGGSWLTRLGTFSALVVGLLAVVSARRAALLIPLALFAAAALPASAYMAGHPFRLRYEIPLVVAAAMASGLAVGLLRSRRPRVAALLAAMAFGLSVRETPPFASDAAMVLEAQIDQHVRGRARVTDCLVNRYDGGAVMISMGALGHYMHELSWAGFAIRDFLHEGNGPIWDSAFTRGPAPLVEWVLVEQEAEGGDAIIQRHRTLPRLLEDYDAICTGGHVTLFRRRAPAR